MKNRIRKCNTIIFFKKHQKIALLCHQSSLFNLGLQKQKRIHLINIQRVIQSFSKWLTKKKTFVPNVSRVQRETQKPHFVSPLCLHGEIRKAKSNLLYECYVNTKHELNRQKLINQISADRLLETAAYQLCEA